MTAEIAVMNRQAIALAADSAVTVGAGPQIQKIHMSANKVFALSRHHPVGVMVYGNAELVGTPWETIIKEYRRHLGATELDTLSDYAEHFIAYLKRAGNLFSKDLQGGFVRTLARACFLNIVKRIQGAVKRKFEEGARRIGKRQIQRLSQKVIEQEHARILQKPPLPGASKGYPARVRRIYKVEIDDAISECLEGLPLLRKSKTLLGRIVSDSLCRDYFALTNSGVVIAGFGKRELFPSLSDFVVEGMAAGFLKHSEVKTRRIDHETVGRIVPFAQKDAAYAFIEGVDATYAQQIEHEIGQTLGQFANKFAEAVPGLNARDREGLATALLGVRDEAIQALTSRLAAFRQDKYVSPVMDVVASLPKDELAAVAEALVNLTSFKRRISADAETVGGPIDVAVISKGDGLIWIKRKHYFKPELNPHFLASYQRGTQHARDQIR